MIFASRARIPALVTRQLAVLVGAGVPLARSLQLLVEQEEMPERRARLASVAGLVQTGHALSEALATQPDAFGPLYVSLVRAGEAGGALPELLARLADFQERMERLRARVVTALLYPAAVLIAAALIFIFLLVWVIPEFKSLLLGAFENRPLPLLTQTVLGASDWITQRTIWVVGLLSAGIVAVWLGRTWLASRWSGQQIPRWIPLVGPAAEKIALAQITRTLGTLVESGVPLLSALEITQTMGRDPKLARALAHLREQVQQGQPLGRLLAASRHFPAMVSSLVQVGEETGRLGQMLLRAADLYDQQVETTIARLTGLVEPVLSALLGVIVGGVVLSLFLPLVHLIQELGGGG